MLVFLGLILIKLLKINFNGIINIGSRKSISKHHFIKKFCKLMSIKNIEFFPQMLREIFKIRNKILNLNIKKLDKLGIKVPSIEQSINLLIKELNEK